MTELQPGPLRAQRAVGDEAPHCPCHDRTLEDQAGNVIWRASATGEWCGNRAVLARTHGREYWTWCEDCIVKRCQHCRDD